MKCPNCNSEMFITDETANSRSHVTFYRCSLCISEHVSSEPVMPALEEVSVLAEAAAAEKIRYSMV